MHNITAFLSDENVCGIELPDHLGGAVHEFLRANQLSVPVIEIAGGHMVHLVNVPARATRAIDSLERCGAKVYRDGAKLRLTAGLRNADQALPPVVVISAAVRAVTSGRGPGFARSQVAPRAIA